MPAVGAGRGPTQREVVNLVRPEGAAISNGPCAVDQPLSELAAGAFFAGRGQWPRRERLSGDVPPSRGRPAQVIASTSFTGPVLFDAPPRRLPKRRANRLAATHLGACPIP